MSVTAGTPRRHAALLSALRHACATSLAVLATLATSLRFAPGAATAVLGAVLCLSLARSQLNRDWRGRVEAAWTLPLLGLIATGEVALLHFLPWFGALVFTAGVAGSIWLRRFGPAARRAGSLIAVPMIAILTTPYAPPNPALRIPPVLVPMLTGLVALLWVSVALGLFRACGWLPPPEPEPSAGPGRESALRPVPSTRMALQMAVALAVAFALGFFCFGEHWAWPVLTAFIVNSGSRGRLDVFHKSLMRLVGALAGTLAAALVPTHLFAQDWAIVSAMLAVLFVGLWLRPINYAWWALCVTLVLALLQDYLGEPSESALVLRLTGIGAGAVIGIAAAWFVYPIRPDGTLRRCMSDALAALSLALDPAQPRRDAAAFVRGLAAVEELAPPLRIGRVLLRALRRDFAPARWLEELLACRADALRLIERGATPPETRRAVGAARKALQDPAALATALQQLRLALRTAASAAD